MSWDLMGTLWMTISELQGDTGQAYRVSGKEVELLCRGGERSFPQTDAGWNELSQHDFEQHERIKHYDWNELHGLEVTLLVVRRREDNDKWLYPDGKEQTEIVARTNDGTYYFLGELHYEDEYHQDRGDFKWKPQQGPGSLLANLSEGTQKEAVSLLLGSDAMGGSSGNVTATTSRDHTGNQSIG